MLGINTSLYLSSLSLEPESSLYFQKINIARKKKEKKITCVKDRVYEFLERLIT